jgi:hypothetical protein
MWSRERIENDDDSRLHRSIFTSHYSFPSSVKEPSDKKTGHVKSRSASVKFIFALLYE